MARPSSYRKDFHPEDFIKLSKKGKTIKQIALEWDISRETIYAWARTNKEFSDTIKRGNEFCEGWWIDSGVDAMMGRNKYNLGFYVWMTKNLFKWSDNKEDEDTKPANINVNISKYVPPKS